MTLTVLNARMGDPGNRHLASLPADAAAHTDARGAERAAEEATLLSGLASRCHIIGDRLKSACGATRIGGGRMAGANRAGGRITTRDDLATCADRS